MALQKNIIINQGSTKRFRTTLKDVDGNPVDLSNVVDVLTQVRRTNFNGPIVIESKLGEGTTVNKEQAIITWTVTADDTEQLKSRDDEIDCVWDQKILMESGVHLRIVEGECAISMQVAR